MDPIHVAVNLCRDSTTGRFAAATECAHLAKACVCPVSANPFTLNPSGAQGLTTAIRQANGTTASLAAVAQTATASLALDAAKRALTTGGILTVAVCAAEGLHLLIQYRRGTISREVAMERAVIGIGGAIGGIGGTATGAGLGTLVFPGLGTAIGGFFGGMAGSFGARAGASAAMSPH